MFSFLGKLFAGSGTRTGTGIALVALQPLARFVLGVDPDVTLQQAIAQTLQHGALGLIGGGVLFKVVKGEFPLPWVRPAAPTAAVGSEVADK